MKKHFDLAHKSGLMDSCVILGTFLENMSASADTGERISLSLQFVASFCWAIGALLAGPASAADFLQFFAAVAWCLANCASAWSLCGGAAVPAAATVLEEVGRPERKKP